MIRTIDRFRQDAEGDWIAELSCLHTQHVRHRPPFVDRPWVTTVPGREAHIGTELNCPLCDRAELPERLRVARTAGPFDADSVPAGLLGVHRVADRTWAQLQVHEGSLRFAMDTDPPLDRVLAAGEVQPIPPAVDHALTVDGPVRFSVDFLIRTAESVR